MIHHWISFSTVVFILIKILVAYEKKVPINLEDYLQPLDVGVNPKYDELINDGKLCSRNCTKYPTARICYYKLVAEQYHAMGPACRNCPFNRNDCFGPQCIAADGIERSVLVFNRMIPGPAFHICFGDRVIVDVENKMPAREVTIHWHGQLQKTTPWEDGVPFVTQCPITANNKFRYDFPADTSGTHFYHSHSSFQLFDGLSGPFVVHTSTKTDPVSSLYDFDLFSHVIQIRDWIHEIIDTKLPGNNRNTTEIGMKPNSYLINGKGNFMDLASKQQTKTPLAEFVVRQGYKYRLRIITDTSTTCSLQFAIEDHPMLLIAADGYPVQPRMVRSLYLSAADIYDVVIDANNRPGSYWIRVQGYGRDCSPAVQQAILRYEGTNSLPKAWSNTPALFDAIHELPELNNVDKPCGWNEGNLCLDEINSMMKAPERIFDEPDQTFYFDVATYQYSYDELYVKYGYQYLRFYLPYSGPFVIPLFGGMYEDTINQISNIFTPFPLLAEPKNPMINQLKCRGTCTKHCDCLHLIKLGYNNVVEMVFVDKLSNILLKENHPFHIHGHHWYIMKLGPRIDLTIPNGLKINTTNKYPLIRDSVPIPGAGYVIVRFIADNPGFWLLHCHFTAHNDYGMQIVLQVGEPEQMPQVPENWPTCGNYLPPVY